MHTLASKLARLPIISLQTSETIAWVKTPIIDMANLAIVAFKADSPAHKQPLVLMKRDIRQFASDCIIVDNEDELVDPADIIRLQELIATDYSPLGKPVVSDANRKLGIVEDYIVELETQRIQKLHLRQPLYRIWNTTTLIIDRTQIIDLTPQQIIVRDAIMRAPALPGEPVVD